MITRSLLTVFSTTISPITNLSKDGKDLSKGISRTFSNRRCRSFDEGRWSSGEHLSPRRAETRVPESLPRERESSAPGRRLSAASPTAADNEEAPSFLEFNAFSNSYLSAISLSLSLDLEFRAVLETRDVIFRGFATIQYRNGEAAYLPTLINCFGSKVYARFLSTRNRLFEKTSLLRREIL